MPADVTVSGLHLAQSLPLMKPFFISRSINLVIPGSGAGNDFVIGSFTMPFYGDIVFQGMLGIRTNAAGLQAPNPIKVSTNSVPAPTTNPSATWRTEAGTGYAEAPTPVIASWVGVAAGTGVTIRGNVTNGTTAIAITIVSATGIAFCTKT
jgi:hypothetical protein